MKINLSTQSLLRTLLLFVLFATAKSGLAQKCDPTWDRTKSSNCVNSPIYLIPNSPSIVTFLWDFGNGQTSTQREPIIAYSSAGTYIIGFEGRDGAGNKCTDTVMINIKESPRVGFIALTNLNQCFSDNKFCFIDTSKAVKGSKLLSLKYLFSDGTLYTINNPKGRDTVCHSFTKPQGGVYDLTIEAEDINGCVTKVKYDKLIKVYPSPVVNFSVSKTDSCMFSTVTFKNLTDTLTKLKDIAKFTWDFGDPGSSGNIISGDSISNTNWYSSVKHRYDVTGKSSGQYVFNAKLTITMKNGCTVSFVYKAAATANFINAKIIADNDSSCYGNPNVKFTAIDGSTGKPLNQIGSFLWNFGDPKSGPNNFDKSSLTEVMHGYDVGSWMVSLNIKLGSCNVTLFDTIKKIGPSTKIEIPYNRVSEDEKYQSIIRDSVHFTNNSVFYHNDNSVMFEDSMLNGKYVFKYPGDQTAIPSKFPLLTQRHNNNVLRLWDFGDSYAPKCTTDTKKNKNLRLNCNWSMDSLPVHWYTPWDQIYKSQFYSTPAEKTVLCKGGKFCFKVNYYRQASVIIPADTLVIVPNDSTFKYAGRTITPTTKEISNGTFRIKKVTSKFKGQATYTPTLSDETWTFYTKGLISIKNINTGTKYTKGAGTVTLKKGDQFELKKGDSATLKPQVWITAGKTITAQPTTVCIDTVIGGKDTFISRSRVFIDSNFHKNNFYIQNSKSYTVTLNQQDTVNALRCKSSNAISLALVAPSAKGLIWDGIKCYAPPSPPFGMTFSVANTKPGTTQRLMKFNFDSAGFKNSWVSHGGFLAPPLPGNAPWNIGYPATGAYPNTFVQAYTAGQIQNRNPGWVTVGLIIGNGRLVSGIPENMDTVWYHNAFRYLYLDARFDIIQPEADKKTACVGDTITFKLFDSGMDSITQLVWNWNDDPGSYYEERFSYYKPYPGPRPTLNDKIITDWKKGDKWLYNYVIRYEFDGFKYKTIDTIITGIMRKWAIGVDISKSGIALENAFKGLGLNVRDIPPTDIGLYLGNGKGTGCIDTSGFGNTIKFGVTPYRDALTYKNGTTWYRYTDYTKKASTIISQKLHWRDSSLQGWETLKQSKPNKYSGLAVTPGVYRHVYKKASRYYPTLNLRNTEGCFSPRNKEVDVGFFWNWSFSDTVGCQSKTDIVLKEDIKYFAYDDPFQWVDTKDYWKDSKRYLKQSETKKIDFNEFDDTIPSLRFNVTGIGSPPFTWHYDKPGIYTIRIAMKDSMGCKDTARQKIYVTGVKAGFKAALNGSNPCQNIYNFTDTSRIIGQCKGKPCNEIIDYTWDFGDGTQTSKLQNPSHKYTQFGTFTVWMKVKTKLGCGDSTFIKLVIGGPQPSFKRVSDSVVCVGDSVIFSNQSKDPLYTPQWIWDFGDGATFSHSGSRQSVGHRYTHPGIYQIHLTLFDDINGSSPRCSAIYPDTATNFKITVNVMICGKISKNAKNTISIFPNPAYDHIFIKGISKGQILIYDISGKEVLKTDMDHTQSIDVSSLTKGTYFIRCTDGNESWNGRFVKVM